MRHFPQKNQLPHGLHFRYTFLFLLWLETPTHARASHIGVAVLQKGCRNPNSRAGFTRRVSTRATALQKPQLTRGLHLDQRGKRKTDPETPTHARASPALALFMNTSLGNPNSRAGFTPVYCIFTLCVTQYIGAVPFLGPARASRALPGSNGVCLPKQVLHRLT